MTQKLAVIGRITSTAHIAGADLIQQVTVDCAEAGTWTGVASKSMAPSHRVLVLLQDALLPPDARWKFMERHQWRVRMARFKGVPSECVILPDDGLDPALQPGADVAQELGVTKYEKPVPASMGGDAVGAFPSFIPRTDEPNFQTVPELVARMATDPWYAAEKADGTSCTAWVDEAGVLHVCSRNWELKEDTATGAQNVYWRAARKYGLDRLPPGMALQFEVVGPGIQGNPMGLADLQARAFSLYFQEAKKYAHVTSLWELADSLGIPVAKLVLLDWKAFSADDLRALAAIRYPNGKHGEGVVVRARDSSWSFKVINLEYRA